MPQLRLRPAAFGLLLVVLIVIAGAALAVGSVNIPLEDVIKALIGREPSRPAYATIVLQFRAPRVLTGMLAGAALAVSGLQMQTLFRNPLADPFVLGISSGASLGVALAVLTGASSGGALFAGANNLGDLGMAAAGSAGAAAALLIVLLIAGRISSAVGLLVLGLMFGYLVGAVVSLLMYFSAVERIQAYLNWSFGSFGGVTWRQLTIFGPAVISGLILAGTLIKPLNALLLGETYARSLGVNLPRTRLGIVLSAALLAGAVTAFCGPIGFLGIAAPHVCRVIFKSADHRLLIPACALVGAIIALCADLAAQLPGSQMVLPLNSVMALVGAPVVIWIILRGWQTRVTLE